MKRVIDLLLVVVAAPVWVPAVIVLAVLVRLRIGAPVLFAQRRPGLHGRIFTLVKFRTMTDAVDTAGRLLPDGERLTPFGRWMRATSLDELPELFNVLRGDMSLVGPRPLLPEYLPLYSSHQRRRHEVPPGITGWAQVKGRNALRWEEKFAFDVWYVDHHSLCLDLRILLMTVGAVLRGSSVSQPGHATADAFRGSRATQMQRSSPSPPEGS